MGAVILLFQSTHSLRSATDRNTTFAYTDPFQSTHSLRSATLCWCELQTVDLVSIHALLAECDCA